MPETRNGANGKREPVVVLGAKMRLPRTVSRRVTVCKASDLKSVVARGPRRRVFLSFSAAATDALLKARVAMGQGARFEKLLAIEPPRPKSIPALLCAFKTVAGLGARYCWLPAEELLTAVTQIDAADRLIGGAADPETETLALVRGNVQTLVVPFSAFEDTSAGAKADFHALGFTDYGHTVVLGNYEASADAILYESDPVYRRRLNKQRRQSEKSFGASLRRLRIQKRLKRTDFGPLAAKTIARIERNESGTPRGKTLDLIARRLGVPAGQIATY